MVIELSGLAPEPLGSVTRCETAKIIRARMEALPMHFGETLRLAWFLIGGSADDVRRHPLVAPAWQPTEADR
jgi:hypothetical protein